MLDALAIFSTPQAWVELATLTFLELVLGIDNLVFIAITTDRLPDHRKSLGRRAGLVGALCMRIVLLCMISWLASLHTPLLTLEFLEGDMAQITARDIIMLAGGIYLVYKGIRELVGKIGLEEERHAESGGEMRHIGLVHAVALIMVMDIIFSLDSVITAVGMVNDLPIMIAAVMIAVAIMIIFANPISEFINRNSGVKILALCFIVIIGVVLFCEGIDVHLHKIAVYYAMGFALIVQIFEIRWKLKGAFITTAVLLVLSLGLSFVFPGTIHIYMGVLGAVASMAIIGLQQLYLRNLSRLKTEGAHKSHHTDRAHKKDPGAKGERLVEMRQSIISSKNPAAVHVEDELLLAPMGEPDASESAHGKHVRRD
ncbi:MAG: TerC family protein [Coriobacteriales bacterium]|jgi:predicted tellurium resistance membrane protein TerC